MAATNYHVGKGYKLVRVGELLRNGDEFWDWNEWRPVEQGAGGRTREKYCKVVRRRVK